MDQQWIKSSFSSGAGQCLESARNGDTISVRDSKDPQGPTLTFTTHEWAAFINGARNGEMTHDVI